MQARTLQRSWLATVALTGAVAAAVAVPATSASAASVGAPAASTAASAAASTSGNATGRPGFTSEALAAGRTSYGAKASAEQVLSAYWTPARMKAAVAADTDRGLQSAARAYEAKVSADLRAGVAPKANNGPLRQSAGTAGTGVAKRTEAAAQTRLEQGLTSYAYNPNMPYYSATARTNGKVFYTKSGINYVCSGSIINSEGKDQVWTAGHCVHGGKGGSWAYNWTFVPAYDDDLVNPRPYGTWSAAYLTSRTAWINSSDFSQDFGVAVMNTNFGGWHIVDYLGGQGITVNKGKSGTWENAFGYTQYGTDDGGNLLQCWGYTSPEWDAWLVWSQTVQIPCTLNRGASGGPWLTNWNGSWGYLNGVNSRVDSYAAPTVVRTGYFDDDAWSLYSYNRYA